MCLVGVVYPRNGCYFMFKNRDLEYRPDMPEPEIVRDKNVGQQQRIIFQATGNKDDGIWGGVNEAGLSLQFTDIYLADEPKDSSNDFYEHKRTVLRKLHNNALQSCNSAIDACGLLLKSYTDPGYCKFDHIILIATPQMAVIIEATSKCIAMQWLGESNYLVRSNWPILLGTFSPDPCDKSVYVSALCRYQRAVELIESAKSWDLAFVKSLLCDSTHGETGFSIRCIGKRGEYQTVSSLIVEVTETKRVCHYVLNQVPDYDKFDKITLSPI